MVPFGDKNGSPLGTVERHPVTGVECATVEGHCPCDKAVNSGKDSGDTSCPSTAVSHITLKPMGELQAVTVDTVQFRVQPLK